MLRFLNNFPFSQTFILDDIFLFTFCVKVKVKQEYLTIDIYLIKYSFKTWRVSDYVYDYDYVDWNLLFCNYVLY